tara:strand:- start:1184 stop:2107 length:924 start_codon:yes stop_codon:yes gene_type:complete
MIKYEIKKSKPNKLGKLVPHIAIDVAGTDIKTSVRSEIFPVDGVDENEFDSLSKSSEAKKELDFVQTIVDDWLIFEKRTKRKVPLLPQIKKSPFQDFVAYRRLSIFDAYLDGLFNKLKRMIGIIEYLATEGGYPKTVDFFNRFDAFIKLSKTIAHQGNPSKTASFNDPEMLFSIIKAVISSIAYIDEDAYDPLLEINSDLKNAERNLQLIRKFEFGYDDRWYSNLQNWIHIDALKIRFIHFISTQLNPDSMSRNSWTADFDDSNFSEDSLENIDQKVLAVFNEILESINLSDRFISFNTQFPTVPKA